MGRWAIGVRLWGKTRIAREWSDAVWKSPWMGAAILVLSWSVAGYWLLCTPSPGKSVGALAVVATVMTFRGELTGVEKTFLTLVLFVFVFVEIRAIDKDRAENAQSQKAFFDAQQTGFSGIATQAGQNFAVTTGGLTTAINGLNGVLITTQSLAALSKENLEDVTGGNRIAAAEIMASYNNVNAGQVFVFVPSRGIIRNVHIRMVNIALFDQDVKNKTNLMAHDLNFQVGDIGNGEGAQLEPPIYVGPGDFVRFNIFFSGLNGLWTENLLLRRKQGNWVQAFRVFRPNSKMTAKDVAFKQVGKGFLDVGEKMNWDATPQ